MLDARRLILELEHARENTPSFARPNQELDPFDPSASFIVALALHVGVVMNAQPQPGLQRGSYRLWPTQAHPPTVPHHPGHVLAPYGLRAYRRMVRQIERTSNQIDKRLNERTEGER